MATQPVLKLTEEEYLERDRANEFRSEYVDGEMFAMSGGSFRHSIITSRIGAKLTSALEATNCTVLSPDMRTRTASTNSYVYPDVSVLCGAPTFHQNKTDILTNPILVVGVLSPSTKNYDQGPKFYLYREIESLKEYILVHTDSVAVSHYSRQPDNSWIIRESIGPDASFSLPSLAITLTLRDLYGNAMDFPL